MGAGGGGDGDRVDVVAGEQIVEVVDKDRLDSVAAARPRAGSSSQTATSSVSGCWRTCAAYSAACTCQNPRTATVIGSGTESFLERSSACGTVSGCSTVSVRHSGPGRPGQSVRAARRHRLAPAGRECNDTTSQSIVSQTAEAFADKVFKAALGTMETFNLYLGDRLGWFDALSEAPATAGELAERNNTQPRYAIEWLEMMAVYGNLTVLDDGAGDRLQRRHALPHERRRCDRPQQPELSRCAASDARGGRARLDKPPRRTAAAAG